MKSCLFVFIFIFSSLAANNLGHWLPLVNLLTNKEARPQAGPSEGEWAELSRYNQTLTLAEFEHLIEKVFSTDESWKKYLKISEDKKQLLVLTNNLGVVAIDFLETERGGTAPARYWRSKDTVVESKVGEQPNAKQPLSGLRIAIDPGHIGGVWAKTEARWFQINDEKPVTEGDMTLLTAKKLRGKLEALGAEVFLTRETATPVTSLRPEDFLMEVAERFPDLENQGNRFQRKMEFWFYRKAEIKDRGVLINQTIKPDLTVCLHYNASAWGNPKRPVLVNKSHFHLLITGAAMPKEWGDGEQRLALLHKLFQRAHKEELQLAKVTVPAFTKRTRLSGYVYRGALGNVNAMDRNAFIWARNLAALRMYQCPVLFCEPYVMNGKADYVHIQAGDYTGKRLINGELRPSIYEEYAAAVTEGIERHFTP